MDSKLFELRDKGTFVPVIATRLEPTGEAERYLLARTGYGSNKDAQRQYVMLWKLEGGPATYDVYDWRSRTLQVAHDHILKHFDELKAGQVIDVEYLLGESEQPKESEMYTAIPHDMQDSPAP